jgi:hypothetical protein
MIILRLLAFQYFTLILYLDLWFLLYSGLILYNWALFSVLSEIVYRFYFTAVYALYNNMFNFLALSYYLALFSVFMHVNK